ncbi:histidine phosphatase superfamily [Cyathus striatus]|nr:histidine phosphatase superfamily [Cyathus striatus]
MSDLCLLFKDNSVNQMMVWDAVYLLPIRERLGRLVKGNLTLMEGDVSLFPYHCGFEMQIVGKPSPWCGVFTEDEILEYEYRQDLRYWYGTGSNSPTKNVMLPIVHSIANILSSKNLMTPSLLVMAFTHDNQINELASSSGIFDTQALLATDQMVEGRRYVSSWITPMRGTILWERLSCEGRGYLWAGLRFMGGIVAVEECSDGPGKSCPVEKYSSYIKEKVDKAGSFEERCNSTMRGVESSLGSIFVDLGLEFLSIVQL